MAIKMSVKAAKRIVSIKGYVNTKEDLITVFEKKEKKPAKRKKNQNKAKLIDNGLVVRLDLEAIRKENG